MSQRCRHHRHQRRRVRARAHARAPPVRQRTQAGSRLCCARRMQAQAVAPPCGAWARVGAGRTQLPAAVMAGCCNLGWRGFCKQVAGTGAFDTGVVAQAQACAAGELRPRPCRAWHACWHAAERSVPVVLAGLAWLLPPCCRPLSLYTNQQSKHVSRLMRVCWPACALCALLVVPVLSCACAVVCVCCVMVAVCGAPALQPRNSGAWGCVGCCWCRLRDGAAPLLILGMKRRGADVTRCARMPTGDATAAA